MRQERMKVLDLLDEGKITAEEAAKLLEAMKKPQLDDDMLVFDKDAAEEKVHNIAKHVDRFTKDFGGRVESAYKEIEPKIKKASQAVLERTAAIFDEIAKSLNESLENARKNAADAEKAAEDCCCDDKPIEN